MDFLQKLDEGFERALLKILKDDPALTSKVKKKTGTKADKKSLFFRQR